MGQFEQAGKTFAERFATARENAAKPFGGDKVPAGTYAGRIRKYSMEKAKSSGRNQLRLEVVISDGDSKGLVARQFQGLDPNDDGRSIGLEIFLRQIAFFGYEVPESATTLEDLAPIAKAIEDEGPEVEFKFTMNGDFGNIQLNKLLSEGGNGTEVAEGGETEPEAPAAEAPAESKFEDEDHEKLVTFGLSQGVAEIMDGMSKADVVAALNGYTFWSTDCAAADLKGTAVDGQKPADGISPEDCAWLLEQGVIKDSVIVPKPRVAAPAKAAVKAPVKAAVKAPAKKSKR